MTDLVRPPLSHDQILWWLRKFRFDSEYRSSTARLIPLSPFCRWCGVSHRYIGEVIGGSLSYRHMGEETCKRLTTGIEAVKNGLFFRRVDGIWEPVGEQPKELEPIKRRKWSAEPTFASTGRAKKQAYSKGNSPSAHIAALRASTGSRSR